MNQNDINLKAAKLCGYKAELEEGTGACFIVDKDGMYLRDFNPFPDEGDEVELQNYADREETVIALMRKPPSPLLIKSWHGNQFMVITAGGIRPSNEWIVFDTYPEAIAAAVEMI